MKNGIDPRFYDSSFDYIQLAIGKLRPRADRKHCLECGALLPLRRKTFCSDNCNTVFSKKFSWEEKKKEILARDNNQCQFRLNGKICGRTTTIQIHHKIPVRIRPDLVLTNTNLESLCRQHHEMKEKHWYLSQRRKEHRDLASLNPFDIKLTSLKTFEHPITEYLRLT